MPAVAFIDGLVKPSPPSQMQQTLPELPSTSFDELLRRSSPSTDAFTDYQTSPGRDVASRGGDPSGRSGNLSRPAGDTSEGSESAASGAHGPGDYPTGRVPGPHGEAREPGSGESAPGESSENDAAATEGSDKDGAAQSDARADEQSDQAASDRGKESADPVVDVELAAEVAAEVAAEANAKRESATTGESSGRDGSSADDVAASGLLGGAGTASDGSRRTGAQEGGRDGDTRADGLEKSASARQNRFGGDAVGGRTDGTSHTEGVAKAGAIPEGAADATRAAESVRESEAKRAGSTNEEASRRSEKPDLVDGAAREGVTQETRTAHLSAAGRGEGGRSERGVTGELPESPRNDGHSREGGVKVVDLRSASRGKGESDGDGTGNRNDGGSGDSRGKGVAGDNMEFRVGERGPTGEQQELSESNFFSRLSGASRNGAETSRIGQQQAELHRFLRESGYSEIVRNARVVLRDGGNGEIRLNLTPKELGSVRVQLQLQDSHIAGRIIVENSTVREVFEQNLDQLQRAFQSQGLETGRLEVSVEERDGSRNQSGRGKPDRNGGTRSFEEHTAQLPEYDYGASQVNLMA